MHTNISPYIFDPTSTDKFFAHCAQIQNAYFWASVFEYGTGVGQHIFNNPGENFIYLVDPVAEGVDGCLLPEEFLAILTGHYDNGRYWGYSWTIKSMVHEWEALLSDCTSLPPGTNTKEVGISICPKTRTYQIILKEDIWQQLQ